MRVLVSRCLLGERCRYDGGSKPSEAVRQLCGRPNVELIAVCPEVEGGLPTPRPPAEIQPRPIADRVLTVSGTDVTEFYERGCASCLRRIEGLNVPLAVLKAKSPACGVGVVYDGTHTGTLTAGDGMLVRLLRKEGVCVATEDNAKNCSPSVEHPVAIVLGTGLGHLAQLVKPVRRIDYHDIDGFPEDARPIAGHSFEATIGSIDGVPVVVYPGRIHLYQGYSAAEVTSLVRHAHHLGCKDILFACATGAVQGMATMGLGVLTDQINLTGHNPLAEWDELRDVDTPFVGMTEAYSSYLRGIALGVAQDEGIALQQGVYAGVLGPSFETPAEVAALRAMGVSFTGMSTVNEVIMARALGMNVLGLTLAANFAGDGSVTHQSVLVEAQKHADDFEKLVRGVLAKL